MPTSPLLRWLFLTKQSSISPSSGKALDQGSNGVASEQGVTILECLVAIAVIAITGALITPPLFIAAATRVQNQRAEQALQIAQGEVDRIRVMVERGGHRQNALPRKGASDNLEDVGPPTSLSNQLKSVNTTCDTYDGSLYPINQALRVDTDGDCDTDFLLQVFRSGEENFSPGEAAIAVPANRRPTTVELGVRVYSNSAADNLNNLVTEEASLKFTSGDGNQRERPLAVLYSNIQWSDTEFSLCEYHDC